MKTSVQDQVGTGRGTTQTASGACYCKGRFGDLEPFVCSSQRSAERRLYPGSRRSPIYSLRHAYHALARASVEAG